MPKQVPITPEVRAVLEGGSWNGTTFILPAGQLARPLYEAVNKVLIALGGKWNRALRGHLFTIEARADLDAALQAGVAVDQKRTNDQFFTPPEIARRVAALATPLDRQHVLEPSAGDGALVRAVLERGAVVTAVERDSALMAPLLDLADQYPNSLLRICEDFLEWDPVTYPQRPAPFDGPFDRVVMNPPFSRGVDIDHVTRAFRFLRVGGVLVAIMSPHWRFAEDAESRGFRHMTNQHGYIWEPLPEGSFRSAGTGVNTGILTISKGDSL